MKQNSPNAFQTQVDLFSPQMPTMPFFTLEVPGRMPSWNELLAMEHWARYKFKKELADAFLSALRASAADSSTKITSAKNTMLTYADTLDAYLKTRQEQRKLKSRNKRLAAKNVSLSVSKCFELGNKVPF